jgi:hypothetical protein
LRRRKKPTLKHRQRIFDEERKREHKKRQREKEKKRRRRRKRKKKHRALFSLFDNSGMFHSDDERNRNVDPYNESQQSYAAAATTTTTTDKRNTTCTFELGQFTPCDFDTFGFDFDSHFGGRGDSDMSSQWTNNNSSTFFVGTTQCSTTFSPEDKWPI